MKRAMILGVVALKAALLSVVALPTLSTTNLARSSDQGWDQGFWPCVENPQICPEEEEEES